MAADDNQSNLKHGKTTSTGAVSPNGAKKPKDRVPVKPELTEINQYLMCSLCSGYLIDATAIIECQHTFCKSCILKYLETNSYCPICDVQLNKAKPHMSLRSDVIVQRLVYKLVPGLLVSELRKRRDFGVLKCGIDGVEAAESASNGLALEVESASDLSTILSLEDVVSLSIEYFRSDSEDANSKLSHEKQEQPVVVSGNSAISCIQEAKESEDSQTQKANDRRYLQCPAAVSVGLLKKFIRMKYGLSDDYRVDLLYNGDRDNILESDLTLLDVAFIFKWNKDSNEPMNFQYRIFEKGAKPLTSRTATKRSASSMMDEPPPDDDGAAGPQNRPSMTSTSPSSKMPRLSERDNSTSTGANSSGNTGKSSSRSTSSTLSSTTPVYEFTEGTDDSDFDTKKGKSRGYHRLERSSQSSKKSPILSSRLQSSSSRSHSTEGKQGKDTSSAATSVQVERRSASTSTARGRSNSVGGRNDVDSEEDDDESSSSSSDSQEIARPKNSNSPTGTTARLRSAAQHVLKNQMNGSLKFSLSTEKREPLKLSLATKNLDRRHHKHRHHKMKHKDKGKHVKVNINLGSQGGNSSSNSNSNQSTGQSHKLSGKEVKHTLGKTHGNTELGGSGGGSKGAERKGNGNASGGTNSHNNLPAGSVKTATSAHLSAISKSISVSIGGVNMQGNNGTSGNNSQHGKGSATNKVISPTELLPKNTGIEIQPTTILHSTSTHHQSSSSTGTSNNQSVSARTHPLLPDSVHVPKSVTLIPVNPNAMSGCPSRGNSSGNSQEKSGSSATQTRFNSHTFTHPITNKSLHQITVTEVPPPSKSTSPNNNSGNNGGNGGGGNSVSGNSGSVTTGNHCGMGNSSSSSSNPIEKAMSHGGNSKPQFNGPGSMEITKIYCGMKENPAKKLKERKGLDISISVPGMTIKDKSKPNLSSQKLEETLRQKMGSGGVTVNNKIKPNSSGPSGLLNARMPPGITIGPAGINKSGLGNIGANSNSTGSNGGGMSGTNAIKGLGFTLPPHITAHPQLPPGGMKGSGGGGGHQSSIKSNEGQSKSLGGSQPQNRSFPGKDQSTNMTGNLSHKMKTPGGSGSGGQSTMETLLNGKSSGGGSKNQINRKHLGEALASMLEMAQRNPGKSPSPPKTSQPPKEKTIQSHLFSGQSNQRESGSLGSVEKRAHSVDSNSSSRKNSSESPEPKRPRGGNESKSSSSETPLDLSGRSSRPNSALDNTNSSSPILGSGKPSPSSSSSPSLHPEKAKSTSTSTTNTGETSHPAHHSSNTNASMSGPPNSKQASSSTSTSVPKISSPPHHSNTNSTTNNSRKSASPSLSSSHKSPHHSHHHHHNMSQEGLKKSLPSPNPSSVSAAVSSASILSIAQSLAQKQLQQQQQQNLHNQIMQLHQQHLQHSAQAVVSSAAANQGKVGMKGSSGSSSLGLPSLSPPIIPMPNPSPPGTTFDPLRNLLTLSDAAVRQGKMHPMNNLMAAVGLCPRPPPPPPHGSLTLGGSPGGNPHSLYSHLSPHLVSSLGGGKSPTGILDAGSHAHLFGNLAALSAAHNERIAAAAGINHFGSSLSPPLSLANPFYSGVGVGGVRPPSNSPHGGGSVGRISGVSPTSNNKGLSQSPANCSKKGSTPPLGFSHPPTSHSPTGISRSSPQPKLPSTSPSPSSSNLPTHSNNSTHSKLTESSSSSGLNSLKNIKINGTVSNPLPLLPPGIHNPLLPIYTRNQQNSSSSGKSSSTSTTNSMNKSSSSSSDKKGIPNSMKISNFLPSKPKDGKAVDTNVEATITSGSNVGGSSLTKFLNSIPPLIVSQSQPNLSVSSAPPKDASRMLNNTFQGKSDKERISIYPASMSNVGGTTTSASSKCVVSQKKLEVAPVSSGSNNGSNKGGNCPVLKPIKNEPTSPTATVSSRINNVGLLPNEKSPTPKVEGTVVAVGLQQTSPIQSKSSSVQIKSEHVEAATVKVTAVESSSTSKLTPSSVGVLSLSSANLISPSSSSSSGRTTQPQNQAVRHIPNPSLLFNRQNNTLVVPSLVSTSSNSPEVSNAVSAKSSPQDVKIQTSPLGMKLDGHTLQVPAIPCPGVSVPVQVKVDNDSIPIPVPTTEVKKETTEPVLPNNACSTTATTDVRDDKTRQLDSCVQEEKHENKLDGSEQESMPQECQTEVKASETKEEIMKIDYSLEDADVDIDVGTETTPLFPSNDEGNDDLEEEKISSLATIPKQNEIKEEEEVLGQPEITSQDTSDLIQTKEEVIEVEEKKGDGQNDTEIIKEGSDNEEKPCLNEANLEQEQTQMEIENDDESRRVNMLEKTVEHEEKLVEEVETVVTTAAVEMGIPAEPTTTTATATAPTTSTFPSVSVEEDLDVGMEEPMEVQSEPVLLEPLDNELEENEKVPQNEGDNSLSHMEIDEVEPQIEIVDEATTSIKDYTTGSDETTLVSHNMIPALDSTSNLVQTECGESTEPKTVSMDHESQSTTEECEVNKEEKNELHIQSGLGEDEISKIEETTNTVELDIIESEDVEMTECDREDDNVSHENTEAIESTVVTVPSGNVLDEKTSTISVTQPELSVPVRSPVSIELKEDKEVVLVVVPQSEEVLEGPENEIPELNGLSNQIPITSEPLQVTDRMEEIIETLPIQDASSPVDLKEDAECVTTLAPSEVKLDELMESSSSSSQLETDSSLNVVHGQNASLNEVVVSLDGKLEGCEELEDTKVENNSLDSSPHEKERLNKLEDSNEIPPTICGTDDEVPATSVVLDAPSLVGDEPGSSQNIAVNPEGGDESVSTLNESLEKNTEAVSNVTFQDDDKSLVPSISTSSITFTSDASGVREETINTNQSTQVTEEPTKEETIKSIESSEESVEEQTQIVEPGQEDILIKPELISATATITTTTTTTTSVPNSVTSTVEIKLGIPATSIASSIPKTENEGTSIHNIVKIDESFEKVAAGLIASAASTINNNNNTSLSIPPPTCDITITNANA